MSTLLNLGLDVGMGALNTRQHRWRLANARPCRGEWHPPASHP
jgi:hypothetical protein